MRLDTSLVCALVLTTAAAADTKKYTVADLEQLVAQSQWTQAAIHLADVPKAKRNAAWIEVATKIAVGRAKSEEPAWGLPRMLEIEQTFPALLKSPVYTKARAPAMHELLEACMKGPKASGSCMEIAKRAAKAVPTDRAFALKLAKLGRQNGYVEDSLPLFAIAVGGKDHKTACEDDDLESAMIISLGYASNSALMPMINRIAFQTCWSALKAPLLAHLGNTVVTVEFRENTCKQLARKPSLVKPPPAACAKK